MARRPVNDFDILSSPEKRSGVEERWVSFQPYLFSKGYRLRPRYQPDWIPSWKDTGIPASYCEDSIDSIPIRILDATRIVDNCQVVIKMLFAEQGGEGQDELAILQRFSQPPLIDNPSNHVVPCFETFPIPNTESGQFVVMPLLGRYDEPRFRTLAEVHDCLKQLFDGLSLMHENDTTHCDISAANIMMDARPLYDEPFHPVGKKFSLDIQRMIYPRYTRLEKHVRYYFIDMGYATWFRNPKSSKFIRGKSARVRAPEQKGDRPYNPFLVDVYQLGVFVQQDLIPKYSALEILRPLATEMTRMDPATRADLTRARQLMNTTFVGMSGMSYRWPLAPPEAGLRAKGFYFAYGVVLEIEYWLRKIIWLFRRWKVPQV